MEGAAGRRGEGSWRVCCSCLALLAVGSVVALMWVDRDQASVADNGCERRTRP